MSDFKQKNVSELREILVNSGKYSIEQADNIKGKGALVQAVLDLENDVVDFKTAKMEEEIHLSIEKPDVVTPDYNDPRWHDFVMKHFEDSELQDGKYPKVVGLRRVAQMLLGDIVDSGPIMVVGPTVQDKPGRATVTFKVVFDWKMNGLIEKRTFTAVAGAWIGNTDDEYAVYPEAIAETRAEVRALRRALNLKVAGAEEICKKDTKQIAQDSVADSEWKETDSISSTQMNFIKKQCEQLGINMDKFINSGKDKFNNLEEIKRSVAADMIKKLSEYKTKEVPAEIKLDS